MAGGRPPKLFTSEQAEELGKDLLEWMETPHAKGQFMWHEWYLRKHGMLRDDWKALIKRDEFLPYYNTARKLMASNMIENKNIHHSYGHRYLNLYDDDVREAEREEKAYEASLNKEQESIEKDKIYITVQDLAASLSKRSEESKAIEVDHNSSSESDSQ